MQVHRSHPEAVGLSLHQLRLLSRVRGPRLHVVLREGPRAREEIMRAQGGLGTSTTAICGSGASSNGGGGGAEAGWGSAEGLLVAGSQEVVLDPADLRLLGGAGGAVLGAAAGGGWGAGGADDEGLELGFGDADDGADGGGWMQDWLPDQLGGLHL
jgi:hypothetical protein